MSDDLVRRLLDPEWRGPGRHLMAWDWIDRDYAEAAARIEGLEAENQRLREAILNHRSCIWGEHEVKHPEDVYLYAALAPQGGGE